MILDSSFSLVTVSLWFRRHGEVNRKATESDQREFLGAYSSCILSGLGVLTGMPCASFLSRLASLTNFTTKSQRAQRLPGGARLGHSRNSINNLIINISVRPQRLFASVVSSSFRAFLCVPGELCALRLSSHAFSKTSLSQPLLIRPYPGSL
jgi:hypothetical protein